MSDRLLKESDVLKAIDKRIEELSKDPVFIRKNGIIDVMGVKKHILAIPSVERPQGEWIGYDFPTKCSVCGHDWDEYVSGQEIWYEGSVPNFCPNCGAYMKGADDEHLI